MSASGTSSSTAHSMRNEGAQTFPKSLRLLRRSEFLTVQGTGRKFHGRHFLVVMAPRISAACSSRASGRVGITTSKKVGNAVVRNRIRRWVREHVRTRSWIPPGMDVVVIAKRSAGRLRNGREASFDLDRIGSRLKAC